MNATVAVNDNIPGEVTVITGASSGLGAAAARASRALRAGGRDHQQCRFDAAVKGVLHGIAAALPPMQKRKSGHIINVASVAGHKVRAGSAVYSGRDPVPAHPAGVLGVEVCRNR